MTSSGVVSDAVSPSMVRWSERTTSAAISVMAGVCAASVGASPTGSVVVDAAVVTAVAGVAVASARFASWSICAVVSVAALAFAPGWWTASLALAAFAVALAVGRRPDAPAWINCVVIALAVQVFARLGDVGFFGFSSALAVGCCLLVVISAWVRAPRHRRLLIRVAGGIVVAGVASLIGLAAAALGSRSHLEEGSRHARSAIAALGAGRLDEARTEFDLAGAAFAAAHGELQAPWAVPAALVPVAAQHRRTGIVLAGEGAAVSGTIAAALDEIDVDSLQIVDGRIDLPAIASFERELTDVSEAVDELEVTLERSMSPWLVDAVGDRLLDLDADIDEQQVHLEDAIAGARAAPAMLGAHEVRRYFIGFTTASEARALGGFMGNWAEATIDRGSIEFTGFGSHLDLNEMASASGATLNGPSDAYLDSHGAALLADRVTGTVGPSVWSNITASPHFASVAMTIAELYPQSGGVQVDGVFLLDVEVMAAILEITGPIELPDAGVTLSPANAAAFLLADQYLMPDRNERRDMLATVAEVAMERLLTVRMPAPPELGDLFGPLARQGRLLAWAARPEEQAVFERAHMSGLLPPIEGADGLGLAFTNAGGSKIDSFLRSTADYDVEVDRATGSLTSTLTLHLSNTAPSAGLPDYVIGNHVDEPDGTSVLYVTVYSALPATSFEIDGVERDVRVGSEQGYVTTSSYVRIGSKRDVTVTVAFGGRIDAGTPYRMAVSLPPLVHPVRLETSIDGVPQRVFVEPGVHRAP